MKTVFKILLLIISSALIISCGDDDPAKSNLVTPPALTPQDTFKYPTKLGSFWYYSTKNFIYNIRPDSLNVYFTTDTTTGIGSASFARDTIINSDTLRVLRNSHSEVGHSHTTIELYNQTDTGLVRIAFYSDGINFGPYRAYNNLKFAFHGRTFSSLNELTNFTKYERSSGDTTLYFDNPPLNVLKYPTVPGTEWNFIKYGFNTDTTRITKKYTGYEMVSVPAGTFYCIKVKRDVYYNSPNPDPNYFYYDYFSDKGMVKRDFVLKDISIANSTGNIIGYIDVKEEAILNLYTLQ